MGMNNNEAPAHDTLASLTAAYRYGVRYGDCERIDARRNSGRYTEAEWHAALDGNTLAGYESEYKEILAANLNDLPPREAVLATYDAIADLARIY